MESALAGINSVAKHPGTFSNHDSPDLATSLRVNVTSGALEESEKLSFAVNSGSPV